MFEKVKARDNRNYNARIEASARSSFDPLLDLYRQSIFRDRYRFTKKLFKFLCKEFKRFTKLRSSQRVSLEPKVLTALLFYASRSYQRPVGVAKHISQIMCSVYIEQVTQALYTQILLINIYKFQTLQLPERKSVNGFSVNMVYLELLGVLMGAILKLLFHKKKRNTGIIAGSTIILLMFKWYVMMNVEY